MDRYAVIGNPVAHSKSPQIHAAFARATGQVMSYERLLAPLGGFADVAATFAREGGLGLNVTVPFKLDALAIADKASERAHAAGACNTLKRENDEWYADNTDGAGIMRDLTFNLGVGLRGRDVLVLGAGGAARGDHAAAAARGAALDHDRQPHDGQGRRARRALFGGGSVRRGRAAGIAGHELRRRDQRDERRDFGRRRAARGRPGLFRPGAFAYDMVYGDAPTTFLRWARAQGAARWADGLGMLVEQAAESFVLWRGVRPDTRPVFEMLRPRT